MTLQSGFRLGPYEVSDLLGRGGMGEVYRARDTRLERDVAIKVLPESMQGDRERLQRFEREAKILSQLEHPHVCRLYDIGREGETDYLVMELLEGETLRQRLDRARLEPTEAIRIASEIAEGLEAAHRRGLVHRDLKPGNVLLTTQGAKILDFGLARPFAFGGEQETLVAGKTGEGEALTGEGTLTGTLQYMAPEQVEGKEVDHRSDLFALGAIFYEMWTGERAFSGDSSASVIASILGTPPERLETEREGLPPGPRQVLEHCLAREPEERWQSARDVVHVLKEDWVAGDDVARRSATPWRWLAAIGIPAALIAGSLAAWTLANSDDGAGPQEVYQLRQQTRRDWDEYSPQISPDGQFFAFAADPDGAGPDKLDIYLLRVDGQREIRLTRHPGRDFAPAFSPDGKRIAFCSRRVEGEQSGSIFVMGSMGESERKLTDGGCWPSWSPDGDRIVFSDGRLRDPRTLVVSGVSLKILDLETGATESLRFEDINPLQPTWSPDGEHIAFWGVQGGGGNREIFLYDLISETLEQVTRSTALDWSPTWGPEGDTLFFSSDRSGLFDLWQVSLDGRSEPQLVGLGAGDVFFPSFSGQGDRIAFARRRHRFGLAERAIESTGRLGVTTTLLGGGESVLGPRISPDGTRIAFYTLESDDLWILHLSDDRLVRLTEGAHRDRFPHWSPSGDWIVFHSDRGGQYDLWALRSDGTDLVRLTEAGYHSVLWPHELGRFWVTPAGERSFREFFVLPVESAGGDDPPRLGEAQPAPTCHGDRFYPVSLSPDGTRLLGGSVGCGAEGGYYVLDVESGATRYVRDWKEAVIPCWLDDRRVVFPGDDLIVIDTADGAIVQRERGLPMVPGVAVGCTLSPDGSRLFMNTRSIDTDIWLAERTASE